MREFKLPIGGATLSVLVKRDEEVDYVAVKPICDQLNVVAKDQRKKLRKRGCFNIALFSVSINGEQARKMVFIPVRQLGLWLCSISPAKSSRVNKELIYAVQGNLAHFLYEALFKGVTPEAFYALKRSFTELQGAFSQVQKNLTQSEEARSRLEQLFIQSEEAHSKDRQETRELRENLNSFMSDHYSDMASNGGRAMAKKRNYLKLVQ